MSTSFKFPYINYLAAILFASLFSSCQDQEVADPGFDATVEKTSYRGGEPVTFAFTGGADMVTFFSGEVNKEFRYKTRDTVSGKPQLQFTSFKQASTQENTLSLLVSTDFSGNLDIPSVQAATWKDMTAKASLSTGADNTPSGVIDLSEFLAERKPVYIAFKYTATKASAQPAWTIKNLAVENVQADGSKISLAASANIAWGPVNVLNSAKAWTFNTTQIQFTTSAAGTDDNEDWIIAQPLQLNRVARNVGVNVKASPTTKLTSYVFPGYTKAGTYVVTFEAINANKWDKRSSVKEFTITVQ